MTATVPPSLNVLGSFALRIDGGDVAGLPRKSQALLAFLAMQPNRRISRELVADLLWTRSAPVQARHSLRQLLVVLRRTPAGGLVRSDGDRLWIEAGTIAVDALALEDAIADGSPAALSRAAALYRGSLLRDVPAVSPGFEEWLRPQRVRLASVMAQALRRLAAMQLAAGELDAATRTAFRLVDMDALDETAHRLLMDCLARTGQRAEALRQFDRCVRTLREELNVRPEAETVALAERIRAGAGLAEVAGAGPRPDADAGQAGTAQPLRAVGVVAADTAPVLRRAAGVRARRRRPLPTRFVWTALAIGLIALSLGAFAFWPSPQRAPAIMVAGFHNVSGVPAQNIVVAGFNDLVNIGLAMGQHLRLTDDVRGGTGRSGGPVPEVRYRLEGTAALDAEAMRVTVRLTDARRGTELWSERYGRPIAETRLVADDIATHTARAVAQDRDLLVDAPQPPIADRRRAAQELVALGHQADYFRATMNRADEEIYRLALEFDKDDVDALADLANVYIRSALAGSPLDTGALTQADATLQHAMRLDPTNAYVLHNTCLLRRLQGRISDSIAMCRRALDIDPHYAAALRELGHDWLESGDAAQAIASYRAAIDAGPHLPLVYNAFKGLGVAFWALGRRAEAIADFQKAVELDTANEDDDRVWLAAMLQIDGRRAEAVKMFADFTVGHRGLRVDAGHLRLLSAPAYADRRQEVLAALAALAQFEEDSGATPDSQ